MPMTDNWLIIETVTDKIWRQKCSTVKQVNFAGAVSFCKFCERAKFAKLTCCKIVTVTLKTMVRFKFSQNKVAT